MAAGEPMTTTEYVTFVFKYGVRYTKKVTFYPDVYAYNHTEYGLQPFDGSVPERFFIVDGQGKHALAPIVLDVTDAMRLALYGGDIGKTALFYGQYTERVLSANQRHWGYSGIHEGIDFIAEPGQPIYSILEGDVLRAGYGKDRTIAIYNETYNATVLYLHTSDIRVKQGAHVTAGTLIAHEGRRGSADFYTHVETRFGRRTSPNPYRDVELKSDPPYDFFMHALGVTPSGREPVTVEALIEAELMRLAAEAEAQAAREAEELRLATPTPEPTQQIEILEQAPSDLPSEFGFANTPNPNTPLPTMPPDP